MKKVSTLILVLIAVVAVITAIAAVTVQIDQRLDSLEERVNDRLVVIEVWAYDQIEKNVLKQADKITSGNFEDIKTADLEDALKYFPLLENPSEASQIAYQIVVEYYQTVIGYELPTVDLGESGG